MTSAKKSFADFVFFLSETAVKLPDEYDIELRLLCRFEAWINRIKRTVSTASADPAPS